MQSYFLLRIAVCSYKISNAVLSYTLSMNIDWYASFLKNTLDTIVMGVNNLTASDSRSH